MAEDGENELRLKMSNYILGMDDELRDRFKALKAIQDEVQALDNEERHGIRKLEIEFEEKY